MALSAEILAYQTNHPLMEGLTNEEIVDWYSAIPQTSLGDLSRILTLQERVSFFANTSFSKWYSQFNQKIIDGVIANTYGLTTEQIDQKSSLVLAQLLGTDLTTDDSLPVIVRQGLMFRKNNLIPDLLLCLGIEGTFTQLTLLRLKVELNKEQSRWITLGEDLA